MNDQSSRPGRSPRWGLRRGETMPRIKHRNHRSIFEVIDSRGCLPVRFQMQTKNFLILLLMTSFLSSALLAVESGVYRLLSIAESTKLILISTIPTTSELPPPQPEIDEDVRTKYLLDASAAKITVNGEPAEFMQLQFYSLVHVKFELKKGKKGGVKIDGTVSEIKITLPDKPIQPPHTSP